MDVLTDVLTAARVGGAVFASSEARAPWGLHFEGSRRANFHIVSQGACWIRLDDAVEPIRLVQGDVALLPRGTGHVLADDPATPAVEFAALASACEGDPTADVNLGGAGPATALVCGSYTFDRDGPHPLLRALPPLVHLPATPGEIRGGGAMGGSLGGPLGGSLEAAVRLLVGEVEHRHPGAQAVVDRLVDILLIYILRAWLDRQPEGCPGWFGAMRDPQIGRALSLVHASPGRRWTIASLGSEVGLSRAAFARRFGALVGESPMAYVARWRMTLAARMLRESDEPLSAVADRVGYDSEFAFAKAFKRLRGQAPGNYRARVRREEAHGAGPKHPSGVTV